MISIENQEKKPRWTSEDSLVDTIFSSFQTFVVFILFVYSFFFSSFYFLLSLDERQIKASQKKTDTSTALRDKKKQGAAVRQIFGFSV